MEVEHIFNLILGVLAGASLSLPLLDYYLVRKRKISGAVTVLAISVVFALDAILAFTSREAISIYNGLVKYDLFTAIICLLASFNALMVSSASLAIEGDWTTSPSYFSLILITLVGLHIIAGTENLLIVVVGWALVSVASYALVGLKKDEASSEGAVK